MIDFHRACFQERFKRSCVNVQSPLKPRFDVVAEKLAQSPKPDANRLHGWITGTACSARSSRRIRIQRLIEPNEERLCCHSLEWANDPRLLRPALLQVLPRSGLGSNVVVSTANAPLNLTPPAGRGPNDSNPVTGGACGIDSILRVMATRGVNGVENPISTRNEMISRSLLQRVRPPSVAICVWAVSASNWLIRRHGLSTCQAECQPAARP